MNGHWGRTPIDYIDESTSLLADALEDALNPRSSYDPWLAIQAHYRNIERHNAQVLRHLWKALASTSATGQADSQHDDDQLRLPV